MFGERNSYVRVTVRVLRTMCQHRQIKLAQFKAEHVKKFSLGVFLLEERGLQAGKASWKG